MSIALDLLNPGVEILETLLVSDIVANYDHMCAAIVRRGNCAEATKMEDVKYILKPNENGS